MIVQIYGTKTLKDAEALARIGVDYIGLDVADDREDRTCMKQIVDSVRDRMTTVLLPVFTDLETSLRIVREINPHIMHLCNTTMLPLDEAKSLRRELGHIKLLQAIPVGLAGRSHEIDSLGLCLKYQQVADFIILDTYTGEYSAAGTEVPGMIGITGRTHDWDLSRKIVKQCTKPIILAGGLTPENVRSAMEAVHPWGVDSCTGTDICRGKKDLEKVSRFVKAVREFEEKT